MTDPDPLAFPSAFGTLPDQLGDYRLVCPLEHSELGPAFRGEDVRTGTPVVIVVLPSVGPAPELRDRFVRAARAGTKQRHEESGYYVGEQSGWLFYVSPLPPEPPGLADRLDAQSVGRTVTEIETTFVPPATEVLLSVPLAPDPPAGTHTPVAPALLATLPYVESGSQADGVAGSEHTGREPVALSGLLETSADIGEPDESPGTPRAAPGRKLGIGAATVGVLAAVGVVAYLVSNKPAARPDPTPAVEPRREIPADVPPATPDPVPQSPAAGPQSLDRLDPTRIPAAERWPGMTAEVVARVGTGVRQHPGGVGLILPHPDGKWVATLNAAPPTQGANFWDAATLRPAGWLDSAVESLSWLATSPDGRTLAAGTAGGPTTVYDVSGADAKRRSRFGPDGIGRAAFLSDKLLLAAAGGRLTVWDVSGPEPAALYTFPATAKAEPVVDLTVPPDGKAVAVNHSNRLVRVWDLSAGRPAELAVLNDPDRVWLGTAFGPNGRSLYALEFAPVAQVRRWNRDGARFGLPEVVARDDSNSGFLGMAVSPIGRLAVSTLRAGVLRYDVSGPTPLTLPAVDLGYESGQAVRLDFSPDGKTLFTGGAVLRAWDDTGPTPTERAPFDPAERVTGAALAADGSLVTAHSDATLKVWNLTGPAPRIRSVIPAGRSGTSPGRLAVTADGGTAVTANGGPNWVSGPTVWPLPDPTATPVRLGYSDTVADIAVTPDGRHVVASTERALAVWGRGPAGYSLQCELRRPAGRWGRCAISADGRWVAAAAGRAVRLFVTDGAALTEVLEVPASAPAAPLFSPDGATLLVVGKDLDAVTCFRRTTQGWERIEFEEQGDRPKMHEAVFHPTGRSVVAVVTRAGGDAPRLEVWAADTGRVARSLPLPCRVLSLSIAADGRHVCTLNENGTADVYRLPSHSGTPAER